MKTDLQKFPHLDPNAKIILKALEELGYKQTDINGETQLGSMIIQTTSVNGSRESANKAFIQSIKYKRSNLFIKKKVLVNKILIDTTTNKTTGVEYFSFVTGMSKLAKVKKEVILSAGSVNGPKLLMLSGIGLSEELKKHEIPVIKNLSVGLNLQDHVSFFGITVRVNETNSTCDGKLEDFYHYLEGHNGPLSSAGVTSVTTFMQTNYTLINDTAPDIQLMFGRTTNLI